jgi:hypothetical protein
VKIDSDYIYPVFIGYRYMSVLCLSERVWFYLTPTILDMSMCVYSWSLFIRKSLILFYSYNITRANVFLFLILVCKKVQTARHSLTPVPWNLRPPQKPGFRPSPVMLPKAEWTMVMMRLKVEAGTMKTGGGVWGWGWGGHGSKSWRVGEG